MSQLSEGGSGLLAAKDPKAAGLRRVGNATCDGNRSDPERQCEPPPLCITIINIGTPAAVPVPVTGRPGLTGPTASLRHGLPDPPPSGSICVGGDADESTSSRPLPPERPPSGSRAPLSTDDSDPMRILRSPDPSRRTQGPKSADANGSVRAPCSRDHRMQLLAKTSFQPAVTLRLQTMCAGPGPGANAALTRFVPSASCGSRSP